MKKAMCRIPVTARIKVSNGVATIIDAHYEDIPAEDIARFIYNKLGGRIPDVRKAGAKNDKT